MAYKIRVITKKDQLKKPDEFISTVDWLGDQIVEHSKTLLTALGIVVVIGGAVAGYWFYQRYQENQALILEQQARQYYHQSVPATTENNPMAQGENYRKAIELYQKIVQEYPRTRTAMIAQYYLGNSYMELKDYASAVSAYRTLLEKSAQDNVLEGLTYQRLGYAYLSMNQSPEAVEAFESAGRIPSALNKDQTHYELGRLNESLGEKEEAIRNYQEIVRSFPTSLFLSDAQKHLNALGVTEVKPDQPGPSSSGTSSPTEEAVKTGTPAEKPAEKPVPPEAEKK